MNGKFRIWDKEKNKYVTTHFWVINSSGELGHSGLSCISYANEDRYTIEYSADHKDINKQEWYEGDWTIMDDWSISILVYDDEMSCFGFNIHEGENINNYDEDILEFEPLYYYNLSIMAIEGNIHEREVR